MMHKLSGLRIQIDATIRRLSQNKDLTYQELEQLTLAWSDTIDTALNPRA